MEKIDKAKILINEVSTSVNVNGCSDEIVEAIMKGISAAVKEAQKIADKNKEDVKRQNDKKNNKRWKPEGGEDYYYVDLDCSVDWDVYPYDDNNNDNYDDEYYNYNLDDMHKYRNMFKTEEEAVFEAERRKVMAELQNIADEYNGKFTDRKYWIGYDSDEDYLWVDSLDFEYPVGVVLFSSENAAQKAIDIVGKDRIRKYVLGLEEDSCKSESVKCNHDCEDCDYYEHWDEEGDY